MSAVAVSNNAFRKGESWPVRKRSLIWGTAASGCVHVIERWGKFHKIAKPGFYTLIPFIDRVAYVVNCRESTMETNLLNAITKDNATLRLAGALFVQITPEQVLTACYRASDPYNSVLQIAVAAMRSTIGTLELDEIFGRRAEINDRIFQAFKDVTSTIGVSVSRFEITELNIDPVIVKSMQQQVTADRQRRDEIIQSEAKKRAVELQAEGKANALKINANANLAAAEAESKVAIVKAKAAAEVDILAAKAAAEKKMIAQQAEADSIAVIAKVLEEKKYGKEVLQSMISRESIAACNNLGQRSSTLIFSGGKGGGISLPESLIANNLHSPAP